MPRNKNRLSRKCTTLIAKFEQAKGSDPVRWDGKQTLSHVLLKSAHRTTVYAPMMHDELDGGVDHEADARASWSAAWARASRLECKSLKNTDQDFSDASFVRWCTPGRAVNVPGMAAPRGGICNAWKRQSWGHEARESWKTSQPKAKWGSSIVATPRATSSKEPDDAAAEYEAPKTLSPRGLHELLDDAEGHVNLPGEIPEA